MSHIPTNLLEAQLLFAAIEALEAELDGKFVAHAGTAGSWFMQLSSTLIIGLARKAVESPYGPDTGTPGVMLAVYRGEDLRPVAVAHIAAKDDLPAAIAKIAASARNDAAASTRKKTRP